MAFAAGYEVTSLTIDSQLISLAAINADVFMNITSPKFTIQAIRKLSGLPWKPIHIIPITSNFIATVPRVAGLDKSGALISASAGSNEGSQWILQLLRDEFDGLDRQPLGALRRRLDCCCRIGLHERYHAIPMMQPHCTGEVQVRAAPAWCCSTTSMAARVR